MQLYCSVIYTAVSCPASSFTDTAQLTTSIISSLRASFLTGLFPHRVNIRGVFEYGIVNGHNNRDDWLLQVPTIPMVLKEVSAVDDRKVMVLIVLLMVVLIWCRDGLNDWLVQVPKVPLVLKEVIMAMVMLMMTMMMMVIVIVMIIVMMMVMMTTIMMITVVVVLTLITVVLSPFASVFALIVTDYLIQMANYTVFHSGKWHLGMRNYMLALISM